MTIKTIIFVLLMSLATTMCCFSQTISKSKQKEDSLVVITSTQLKQTNIIFLEHQKLLKEKGEYLKQIDYLEAINQNYLIVDSLRNKQLDVCTNIISEKQDSINNLKKSLQKSKKRNRVKNFFIGGIASIAAIIGIIAICK